MVLRVTPGLVILILILSVLCSGQARQISGEQYFDAYTLALSATHRSPRRRVQKTEEFTRGVLTKTIDEIEEVQEAGRRRFVYTETSGRRQTVDETIEVNGIFYCRTNGRAWKKSNSSCFTLGAMVTGGSSETIDEAYSTEQVTLLSRPMTLLRHSLTYAQAGGNQDSRVWENRVWIDPDLLIVRREFVSGDRKTRYTSLVETYDYTVKLTIKEPIKSRAS